MQKVLSIICCLAFFSCTKNEELYFSKEQHGINIWLGTSTAPVDSVTYNFAYVIAGKDSVLFNYRITGYPLDHDTEFELQAVAGDTNLVYYSFGKYTIKAGEYQGTAPIYIQKPENYTEFTSGSGKVVFKLKPAGIYKEGAKELDSLTIAFKNYLAKPDNWDAATYPYRPMSTYFGTYSNVKYAFIIQTTGMVDFKIYYTTAKDPQLEANTITSTKASALQSQCKVALQEHNAQYGILLDENNNQVVFP